VIVRTTPVLVHNDDCSPFELGEGYSRTFDTSVGKVRSKAYGVTAEGETLWLRDVSVMPAGGSSRNWEAQRGRLGIGEVMSLLKGQLGAQAVRQGHTELRLTGTRYAGPKERSF